MLPEPINAILCLLALASAVACIAAYETGHDSAARVFKPLTMVWVLAIALQPSLSTPASYRALVVAGLAFSLAGDVFLMLPTERFVAGLASFLIAHLLYIAAFAAAAAFDPRVLVPFVGLAVLIYAVLHRHVGPLRLPVLAYVATIGAMAWLATARWLAVGQLGSLLAFIGALLFVVSDAALALDRFVRPIRHSPALVLGTYFPAQLLIALSIGVGEALVDWGIR
ncbi:MAG: lysoplasmalogenase [Myxococcota bacterium]